LKLRQIVPWALAFLILDAVCMLSPSLHSPVIGYALQTIAPLLALAACIWKTRHVPAPVRPLWLFLMAALALWAFAMMLSAYGDLLQHVPFELAFISDFFFFFYGVPLLFALSRPVEAEGRVLFRWLDGVQAAFAGWLAYTAIFSALPFSSASIHPISTDHLVWTYDTENIVLAAGCWLRLLAAPRRSDERGFYRLLLIFLVTFAIGSGLYNRLAILWPDHAPPDLLSIFPFLLLAALTLMESPFSKHEGEASITSFDERRASVQMFIDTASPVFFTLALLALGMVVLQHHLRTGIVAIAVALGIYGIRTTIMQMRYLRTQKELREARDRLEAISLQDGLTGVANRRRFDQTLQTEWNRAARSSESLALLLIDLDHFKALNDRRGHLAGDRCLVEVAGLLQGLAARSSDLLVRYGGEEFAVILPGTSLEAAAAMAERMRTAVAALRMGDEAAGVGITASFGVAACLPNQQASPEWLIDDADRALYRAKALGRNRVEVAGLPNDPL
jgi:diguanylate cyclase (GGDEF)-like protein